MPRIAIRFHIHFSRSTIDGKIQNVVTVNHLYEFLTFGLDFPSFEFSPQQVLQGTLIVKVVDLNGTVELLPGSGNKDNPSPPATEYRCGQSLQRPQGDLPIPPIVPFIAGLIRKELPTSYLSETKHLSPVVDSVRFLTEDFRLVKGQPLGRPSRL